MPKHASMEQRFFEKVTITDSCWLWTGAKNTSGYGRFRVDGKSVQAHRYSYEVKYGPLPQGMLACHKCDNPSCVNPDHIFPGSYADNFHDAQAKGRARVRKPKVKRGYNRKGERNNNAKLTAEQVAAIRAEYPGDGRTRRRGGAKKADGPTLKDLAAKYGVTFGHIRFIVAHRNW